MRFTRLTLLLFGIFLLEGTWLNWLIPGDWQSRVLVAPHLVLVAVFFIGLYLDRKTAALYGLCFGLLHDIVYIGPMIGVYCFATGLMGYLAGWFPLRSHGNILTSLFFMAVGSFAFEWFIYGIYRVFEITHVGVYRAFLYHMLPSVLMNLLFALIVYVPVRKLLEKVKAVGRAEER